MALRCEKNSQIRQILIPSHFNGFAACLLPEDPVNTSPKVDEKGML